MNLDPEAILDHVFTEQGFIMDDGSELAGIARSFWDSWWDSAEMPDPYTGISRLLSVLDEPKPGLIHEPRFQHPQRKTRIHTDNVLAWVRTSDLITVNDSGPFPYHHTLDEMAVYLSKWTRDRAEHEMSGAYWDLLSRPGGWAGTVTTNGNHRSLLASASGVPLVRVRLSGVQSWIGEQVLIHPRSTIQVHTNRHGALVPYPKSLVKSEALSRVRRYSDLGFFLCDGDHSFDQFGSLEVLVRNVDPILPWIYAPTDEHSATYYREFCRRFQYDPDQDWKLGSAGLKTTKST